MKWEHSLQGQKPALCTSQGSMSPLQLPCGLSIPDPAALSSPVWESYWGCGSVFTWVLPDAEPETRIQMQVIYLGSASKPAGGWGREIYLYIHSHTNIKKKNETNVVTVYFLYFLKPSMHIFLIRKTRKKLYLEKQVWKVVKTYRGSSM